MNKYIEQADQVLMHTYNRAPVVFEKGEGVYLYDTEGKKYLDFGAGIAVFALGYGNKAYNDALKAQIDKILHTSNLYYSVPLVEAATKVTKATEMDQVFFTNSGTEAIEGAIKLAKKYAYNKGGKATYEIISMKHSFHGRSLGALAVTGQPKYQEAFGPMMEGIVYADFNDLESVKALVNEKTCAIIVEPVQGEGGIYPATQEFLEGLRRICDENDIVLIFDEIQCGMGRTGTMFAYQGYHVKPDVAAVAKALGCGVPVGAFVAVKKVGDAFVPGDHGTTYGGNPFAMAAVSKVFDLFEEEKIVEHVVEISAYLEQELDKLVVAFPSITERRGKGLMQGIELSVPVAGIVKKALENGLVLVSAGANIIRFVPPLIITREDVDQMITILKTCIC